jgi:EAL domain-containing protein (putative c-di-GMP-specific phosphodiesterase class I)
VLFRSHNQLAFFEQVLEVDAQRRVRMFTQLRMDAERNGFSFVAQPKVDRSGCAVGAEILMRWPTEAFGMVSPVEFIPMAEKLGLIGLMGRHAMHAAARLAAHCQSSGQRLPVAVNLSPKQVLQRGLDRQVMLACERAGIDPGLIELELTESALSVGLELVAPVLQNLRKLGFGLALDDFGTGYSSLSYLRHLPFTKIKIDRSFVMDLGREERTHTLLQHMVGLVHALGMTVVAEGVETVQQFELLRDLGIEEFQGYHFARPMPLDQWSHCVAAHGETQILLPQAT